MDSEITIKIVEPGSSPVVPNTGLFTNGIGGPEATIIAVSAVIILVALIAAVLYYRKKKQGKVDSLSTLLKTLTKSTKHKKATIGLVVLALLVSAGTFTTLIKNAVQAATSDTPETSEEQETESSETTSIAKVEDGELVVELGDTPVFAYIPTTITVEEEMPAGYTLKAYSTNPTLSSEGTDKTISLVTIPEDEYENAGSLTTSLTDNTWGLAVEEPTSETDQIFYSLPETQEEAIVIKSIDDYSPTPAGDTTTVYYGVYITPDMPYGTYTGATVSYIVEPIMTSATVVFDGNNKFYFDGTPSTTTNTVEYTPGSQSAPQYSHTPNVNDEGIQTEGEMYPLDSNETFVYEFEGVDNVYVDVVKTGNDSGCGPNQDDYFSIWSGAHADFTAKANWETALSLKGSSGKNVFDNDGKYDGTSVNVEGDAVTIAYTTNTERQSYCPMTGYGYYAKVIGYNPNIATSGEYETPDPNGAYRFLGWSEDASATTPTYKSTADIERTLSLTTGETVTLYAISEPGIVIAYNGNGADTATNMDNVEQYTTNLDTTSTVDLLASNFTRDGYGFVGWSTDQNAWEDLTDDDESNNPVIYGPNQTITVDPSAYNKLALYAVWAPAETDNSGNPIALQGWQGCSSLTATTYDSQTGTLTVGKNTITALTDNRDGNIYTVARLADGNCWMTENLRLDNEPELSSTNTNNPSLPLTNNYEEQTTSNFLSATSSDWCTDYDSAPCYNQSKLNTNNTTFTTASPSFNQDFTSQAHKNFNDNISSYSNYYNWYSATAGNGKQETTTTVSGDICPAGWILPIGNETSANGSFSNLDSNMGGTGSGHDGSNNWRSFPNNFVYSGYWSGSSTGSRGGNGYYWSSTAGGTDYAYGLYFGSGNVKPGTDNSGKNIGYSVRCVAPVQTTITFDGNGSDSGEMADQTIKANSTVPLNPNEFIKIGYKFTGWNTERDGSGTSYANGGDYTAGEGNNNVTLYAQWEELLSMQDVATWGSNLSEGDTIEAVDNRDNKTYYVSRLADGNIWMTQNLDLDLNNQTELTPANTNISANWTPANSTISFTGTTVSGWENNNFVPYSADPGALYVYSSGTTSNDEQYTSLADCQAAHQDCSTRNHVGNYYNWSAAVASNDTSSMTTTYNNAPGSICPAGWRLPTGRDSDDTAASREWNALLYAEGVASSPTGNGYTSNGFNKIRTAPLWLARSGSVYYGSLYNTGNYGYYWSSTVHGSYGAYLLDFHSGDVRPTIDNRRDNGHSVRCLAE